MEANTSFSAPPPDWPQQAEEDYQRIRILGAGAFGQVLLGKRRAENKHCPEEFVAIKGVSILTENEGATAAREIAILSELSHPNVIKLLDAYDPASSTAKGRYMVMSYIDVPDIGDLLEKRGALAMPLVQLVARHLINAVAYLHARGVIHRDIKPDNIMLKGCKEGKTWIDDDLMWINDKACIKAIKKGRFKAVLADFGFARANVFKETERRQSRINMRLSAVGTRNFAAPELMDNVQEKDESEEALSQCVSQYGMMSDAYSVGVTLKEIATGVPPGEDNTAYVKANRKQISKPKSKLSSLFNTNSKRLKVPYPIQLHLYGELPKPCSNLISSLMDATTRISVREAQEHEYIGGYDSLEHGDVESCPGSKCVPLQNIAAFK